MRGMTKHTSAAVKVLADLDAELASSGEALGERLSWTTAELEMREMLAMTIDRRTGLTAMYARAKGVDPKVKLSTEIRQCNTEVRRLLKEIRTDVAQPESLTTIKNRRAANIRWARERNASA